MDISLSPYDYPDLECFWPTLFRKNETGLPCNVWVVENHKKSEHEANYYFFIQKNQEVPAYLEDAIPLFVSKQGFLTFNSHLTDEDRRIVIEQMDFIDFLLSLHDIWQAANDFTSKVCLAARIDIDDIFKEFKYEHA